MTDDLRNCAPETRGRPFQAGNPGKPKGARNRATRLAEKLMAGEIEAIVRAVIEAAKNGDMVAAKIILDRISPVPRHAPADRADRPAAQQVIIMLDQRALVEGRPVAPVLAAGGRSE